MMIFLYRARNPLYWHRQPKHRKVTDLQQQFQSHAEPNVQLYKPGLVLQWWVCLNIQASVVWKLDSTIRRVILNPVDM